MNIYTIRNDKDQQWHLIELEEYRAPMTFQEVKRAREEDDEIFGWWGRDRDIQIFKDRYSRDRERFGHFTH